MKNYKLDVFFKSKNRFKLLTFIKLIFIYLFAIQKQSILPDIRHNNFNISYQMPFVITEYRKCYTLRYFFQIKKESMYIKKFGYDFYLKSTPLQVRNFKI